LLWIGSVAVIAGCAVSHDAPRPAPAPDTYTVPTSNSYLAAHCRVQPHVAAPAIDSADTIDELPEATTKVPPVYPDRARERNIDGTVILRTLVCEHGRVCDLRIKESVPELDESAAYSVSQWVYRPARREGKDVPCWVDVPVRFRLR